MYNMTQPLHTAATVTPRSIATVCNGRTHTWSEVRERTARLAGAIRKLGISDGDNVAILALNSDRYLETYLATLWAGCVVVPMNTRWSAAENAYSLNDSQTSVVFIDAAFTPMVDEIKSKTGHDLTFIYVDDGDVPDGMRAYEECLQAADPIDDAGRGGKDVAGIYYTGGTTGFPKGVVLSHEALWYNGLICAKHFNFGTNARYMHVAPMFHLADTAGSMGTTMTGATHYFMPTFTPDGVINQVAENKITHSLLVPTMIAMVLQHPEFDTEKFSSVQTLIYGASPMPEGTLLAAMEKLPHADFIQGYGQTEMAPLVTTLPPEYHVVDGPNAGKLRSAGKVVVGCEVEIRDEDGNVLPIGEVGEIYARSPGSMTEYLNLPDQTAETLKDGWVRSGDGAYIDEDGFVFIVDRVKDMIVTGGENVFSAEIESTISTHPAVAAVAVVGIPSEKWGEAVHAIVVPNPGANVQEDEIIRHCKEQIAGYKCPKSVSFRNEPLPLSGAGKVLKKDLRAPYWEGQDRGVA